MKNPVGQILRTRQAQLLRAWIEAYRASPLRMPRAMSEADSLALGRLVVPILEGLADALAPGKAPPPDARASTVAALVPGSTFTREIEKAAALVGAFMAAGDYGGFDVAALMWSLRDVLGGADFAEGDRAALARFAEWLTAVGFDAFANARVQTEHERAREQLEDGTPVVLITPELPAVHLVGRPDGVLVDSVLSRLLLQIVRVGARVAIIHGAGLGEPARPEVLEALHRFASHRKVAGAVHVLAVGLENEPERAWREVADRAGCTMTFDAHFDRAVERGLEVSGYRLVRS